MGAGIRRVLATRTFGVLVLFAIGSLADLAVANAGSPDPEAPAAKRLPPKYYEQPDGFGGRKWGDPMKSFKGLRTALTVDASWGHRSLRTNPFLCLPDLEGTCDGLVALKFLGPSDQRRALTIVSQNQIEGQGFRMAGVTLHPVTHFFCGQWNELLRYAPKDLDERMGYCGVRLEFQSETEQALATLPAEHVTQYQRVLRYLILTYGKPFGYHGLVTVYDEGSDRPARRKFPRRYRWCTSLDSIFAPKCNVKMTLTFDAESGKGSLLIAAPPLIQFASAQLPGPRGVPSALYQELFRDYR